jgi:TrmH family RNA methyltransferase
MPEFINSRQNKTVSHTVRLFSQKKYRTETGEFAAEGTKLLSDALESGAEVTCVLTPESGSTTVPAGIRHVVLPDSLFASISSQQTPQGAIFTARIPRPAEDSGSDKRIVLDGVQDPGNLGTILRTAAAMGLGAVLLTGGCADPFSYKTVRASMGSVFRIPVREVTAEALAAWRPALRLAAAMPSEGAVSVEEADWRMLTPVLGSEGQGVSPEILRLCGERFTIPMKNRVESLNVSTAAAIVLWEMSRR